MSWNMNIPKQERGWCPSCGDAFTPHESSAPNNPICPACGSELKSMRNLSRVERSALAFQDWSEDVFKRGLWGPSPGGAAGMLGCDRSMVDRLVDREILERSEYDRDGHFVVMISERSIKRAKENKEKRGKWTDSGEV